MMTIVRLLLLSFFGSSYGAGADTCQSVKGLVLGMGAAMLGGRNAGDQQCVSPLAKRTYVTVL